MNPTYDVTSTVKCAGKMPDGTPCANQARQIPRIKLTIPERGVIRGTGDLTQLRDCSVCGKNAWVDSDPVPA